MSQALFQVHYRPSCPCSFVDLLRVRSFCQSHSQDQLVLPPHRPSSCFVFDLLCAMVRVLLPILAAVGVATAAVQLTTTGCVDPSGLQTCLNGVTATTTACLNQARVDDSQLETLACGCTDYVFRYNCYMAHCWNRVNECEYQGYIAEFLMLCPTAKRPVPYFPAPKGAPDACSCNLGDVLEAITDSITTGTSCTSNQNGGDAVEDVQRIQGCQCCEVSSAISR